jgi:hypothetical protein
VHGTCAGAPDGKTICDPGTERCRAPEDYDPCNAVASTTAAACAPGYACVQETGFDGGVCLQSCNLSSDCGSAYTSCQAGRCRYSACGPGSGPPQNGSFYGACQRSAPGDAYCMPLPLGDGGLVGYCLETSDAGAGAACPASYACAFGTVCVGLGSRLADGGADYECLAACDAQGHGPACANGGVCNAFDAPAGGADPGICF